MGDLVVVVVAVEDFPASDKIIAASSALLRERRWDLSSDVSRKDWASDANVGGAAREEEGEEAISMRSR